MFQQPTQQPDLEALKIAQSEQVRKHYQSVDVAWKIPLLQSAVSAILLSGLAALGCIQFRWSILVIPAVFFSTCLLFWLARLSDWKSLVWSLEKSLQLDLSGDGAIGEPPQPQTVRIEVKSEDGRHTTIGDIPTSPEKLSDLARGILAGSSFSERQWSGSGALFSQNEFRAIRDVFIARGWARWVNPEFPQQGAEFSASGKAVLRTFASFAAGHSPTLQARDREK